MSGIFIGKMVGKNLRMKAPEQNQSPFSYPKKIWWVFIGLYLCPLLKGKKTRVSPLGMASQLGALLPRICWKISNCSIGKSPFLIGKSSYLIGNSPFLIGDTSTHSWWDFPAVVMLGTSR